MGRSFSNNRLLEKLINGEYLPILNWVKRDEYLRIEMRIKNQVKIYYKKSLVLTLYPLRQPEILSAGYCKESIQPVLDVREPGFYFSSAIKIVEGHKRDIKENIEFEIQQKIAKHNSSLQNRFLILDMEYQFAQEKVTIRTKDKTRFDLLALDLKSNKILLLELKQGLNSLKGKAGVDDHYKRFLEHIDHPHFQPALRTDIKGILWSKQQLGFFNSDVKELFNLIDIAKIEFGYVFAAHNNKEMIKFKNDFGNKYRIIYLNVEADNYTLNDDV
jgi:hypothetical protein